MIYVVLGMHKSSTTLVSQILHHSGINMGTFDERISYDEGNMYERQSCLALDMDILGTEVLDVLDPHAPEGLALSEDQSIRMKEIISTCSAAHTDWGFKDPRCALTYDLWREVLPVHRLIVIYRNPAEVWPRFRWNGVRKYHTNFNRAYRYLLHWHEHNRRIIRYLEEAANDYLVLGYKELMSDDGEFARLQDFVGRPLDDRRRTELYRTRTGDDVFLRVATWFLASRKGLTSEGTMVDLASWRERSLARG
jgi:hypothetical protein